MADVTLDTPKNRAVNSLRLVMLERAGAVFRATFRGVDAGGLAPDAVVLTVDAAHPAFAALSSRWDQAETGLGASVKGAVL